MKWHFFSNFHPGANVLRRFAVKRKKTVIQHLEENEWIRILFFFRIVESESQLSWWIQQTTIQKTKYCLLRNTNKFSVEKTVSLVNLAILFEKTNGEDENLFQTQIRTVSSTNLLVFCIRSDYQWNSSSRMLNREKKFVRWSLGKIENNISDRFKIHFLWLKSQKTNLFRSIEW